MLYKTARNLAKLVINIRFKVKVRGQENIPDGACILAMNHTSNFDPLFVGSYTPRKMNIMAKEELFKSKFGSYALHEFGAFPVKRGEADLKSLKHTLRLLKNGELFAIFFEGTRSKTGEIQDPKKGIGFIAAKSKAPVIPTYIYGTKNGWFQKAGVIFGEPITFEEGVSYEEIALKMKEEIEKLKNA